ncbi:MAG TPA: YafY family protein [Reyranella sp.]|nr:YafY family protein [Reyranella sp.]
MRASRLMSILLTLQNRGRLTAEQLAAEFEVSVRTIYRDIDQLSAAQVPVYADRGPGGGFQLLDGYRTKLTGLTESEAETLFLAGLPGPAAELGLADALATAQLKLTAALPERTRGNARKIASRFHLDPVDWFRSAESARLLPAIASAVWSESSIDVRYRRAGIEKIVSRRLKPLGLVLKAGTWYLVAQVTDQPRTYRVSNILDLRLTSERFERPRDFDLVRFWSASSRAYEVGLYRGTAELRLTAKGMMRLEALGATVQQAAKESARRYGSGRTVVTIPIESIDQAAIDILRIGAEAEVVKPLRLRRCVARLARRVAELNK